MSSVSSDYQSLPQNSLLKPFQSVFYDDIYSPETTGIAAGEQALVTARKSGHL